MRGYPHVPLDELEWLKSTATGDYRAVITPQLVAGWWVRWHIQQTNEALPVATVYQNLVVLLIDETAQSAAEFFGQWMKAAIGATLVGSATTGTNGVVASLVLPGGITVRFTGQDARDAAGRQFQRIGLKPDIEARATIRSIKAGREVLERYCFLPKDDRYGNARKFMAL
jgi:C-terminal processing protease CtpA/Prc